MQQRHKKVESEAERDRKLLIKKVKQCLAKEKTLETSNAEFSREVAYLKKCLDGIAFTFADELALSPVHADPSPLQSHKADVVTQPRKVHRPKRPKKAGTQPAPIPSGTSGSSGTSGATGTAGTPGTIGTTGTVALADGLGTSPTSNV